MLNNEIHAARKSVTELVAAMRNDEYFVDNSFQRRLIWTERQKIRLIETILIGYPIPEIYLWKQEPDSDTGSQKSSIVDGQQRLNAVFSFINDEFSLKKVALDSENRDRIYSGKFWSELDRVTRSSIWSFEINIRTIPKNVSKTEIKRIFVRLNETDRSLNPQEMRNAKFNGEFLKASEEVADSVELRNLNVFSYNDLRRMKDIEFSSTLLTFLRSGIVDDTPASLNDMYDLFSDEYQQKRIDVAKARSILEMIVGMSNTFEILATYLSRETHLYTVFVVIFQILANNQRLHPEQIADFFQTYNGFDEDQPRWQQKDNRPLAEIMRRYQRGSSSRIRSKTSREQRIFALLDFLDFRARQV